MKGFVPALFLLSGAFVFSQDLPDPLTQPEALELAHVLGKGLPAGEPPVDLQDQFTALGWSPENLFAFYVRSYSPSHGPVVKFRVLDLVDDRVLFQEELPGWMTEIEKDTWWKAHEAYFRAKFLAYKITPVDYQLGLFPAIQDEEYFSALLVREKGEGGWITRLRLVIHSNQQGSKVVYDQHGAWRWASILGFVPSPFENRLALLFLVQPAGWNKGQQPLRFEVCGTSLKTGFEEP